MKLGRKAGSGELPSSPARRAWSRPKLTRIEAGEAEIGTRELTDDGEFTTS